MEIVLVPSFKKKLEKKKCQSHLEVIFKLIKKLERLGESSVKILDAQGKYLLGEMRSKEPPYRLYVIIDREKKIIFAVDWEHKEHQKRIISKLRGGLSSMIRLGLRDIFT